MLTEVHRYTWTDTNRHEVCVYESPDGRRFVLDRTLDGVPPFFRLTEDRGARPSVCRVTTTGVTDGSGNRPWPPP